MGDVHEAELVSDLPGCARKGEHVAIKIIDPRYLQGRGGFKRFLREGRTGHDVRSDFLMRIFDFDAETQGTETYHYLIMELLEGRTLAQELTRMAVLPANQLVRLARELALALAALHDAGTIHRDLKPNNIMLMSDGSSRLMDLGLAREVDVDVPVTSSGNILGTWEYSSPEQIQGLALGPATDLYSLGVVLYECATGCQPFRADGFAVTRELHLGLVPDDTRDARPELPERLHELIRSLLAKEPVARPASAARVAAILSGDLDLRLDIVPDSTPRPNEPVAWPVVGREPQLEMILAACRDGSPTGQVVLIEGEEGMGRTRLLREAGTRLRGLLPRIEVLESLSDDGLLPGSVLASALLGRFGRASFRAGVARHLREAGGAVQLLASLVGLGSAPSGSDAEFMQGALVQLVRSMSREARVVWLIDDVHQLSTLECALLDALIAASRSFPLNLVLAVKTPSPPDVLGQLARHDSVLHVRLGALSEPDVQELASAILASPVAGALVARHLLETSGGCPLLVVELARDVSSGGSSTVADSPSGSSRLIQGPRITATLRELFRRRIETLCDEDRTILDVAALLGPSFDAGMLSRVLVSDRLSVLQALARMARRRGLVHAVSSGWRFTHPQLCEVTAADIVPELARAYHERIAGCLLENREEARLSELEPELACRVAGHLLRAGQGRRALPLLGPAIEYSCRQEATDLAFELAGLAAAALPERRAEYLATQSELLELRGHASGALTLAREAARLAHQSGDASTESRALVMVGASALLSGDMESAEEAMENALLAARSAGDDSCVVRVLAQLATLALRRGRLDAAEEHVAEAVTRARGMSAWSELARVLFLRGAVSLERRNLDQAEKSFHEAVEMSRRTGQKRIEVSSLGNVAFVHLAAGRAEAARTAAECYLADARVIGFTRGEVHARTYLGEALLLAGRFSDARTWLDQALLLSREAALPRSEIHAAATLAFVDAAEGRIGAAILALQSVLDQALAAEQPVQAAVLRLRLAGLLVATGRLEEAQAAIDAARPQVLHAPAWMALHADGQQVEILRAQSRLAEASELGEQLLARWRDLDVPGEIAKSCFALGRVESELGCSTAAQHLTEAANRARELGLADPGPLPALWRAMLTQEDAIDVDLARLPALSRVEALALQAARSHGSFDAARDLLREIGSASGTSTAAWPISSLLSRLSMTRDVRVTAPSGPD